MKRLFWGFTFIVAACGSDRLQYPESWQQMKAACVGGDYGACADIGHQARAAATPQPERVVISQPIVD